MAFDSAEYWEHRYRFSGGSGAGSTGKLAEFKAGFLNAFVAEHGIRSIIEFGCGDGVQLAHASYPCPYLGLDVSEAALWLCRKIHAGDPLKRFALVSEWAKTGERADLTLSLDVVYHLVEDHVFEAHMAALFDTAERFVVVYSPDTEEQPEGCGEHCRVRKFTAWVEANRGLGWGLIRREPNAYPWSPEHYDGSRSEFFVYGRR